MSVVDVTVCGSTRARDLTLPREVPLADLLPEIVRRIDPALPISEARLCTLSGHSLDPERTAGEAGLIDGQVLSVRGGTRERDVVIFDDVAEALAQHSTRAPAGSGASWALLLLLVVGAATVHRISTSTTLWFVLAALVVYLQPMLPGLALRISGLTVRMDQTPSPQQLRREAVAAHRATIIDRALLRCWCIVGGFAIGVISTQPNAYALAIAGCTAATLSLRLRLYVAATPELLALIATAYAGMLASGRVTVLGSWVVAASAAAVALTSRITPRTPPQLTRAAGPLEILCRVAIGPVLVWSLGVLDAAAALVPGR